MSGNQDVVAGKVKQAEGKAQDVVGTVADSPADNIEGKLKQAEGKIQEGIGHAKQAVKRAANENL